MEKAIPSPVGRWLFGNAKEIDSEHYHTTLWNWKEEFGPIYQFRVFTKNVIVINDMDLMKNAFDIEDLCHRPSNFASVLMYKRSGVVCANFSEQQRVLKKIVWGVLFETQDDTVLKTLFDKELMDFVDSLTINEDVDIHADLERSIAAQMASQFIGIRTSEVHSSVVLKFLDATNELHRNGRELLISMFPWLQYIPGAFKRVVNDLRKNQTRAVEMFMQEARDTYIQGQEHSILHRLFAKQKSENDERGTNYITDENLYGCILEFLKASVVPISQHIEFAILSAVINPDMQETIHQEIKQVGPIQDVSVKDLPYFRAFVLESLRYFSMVLVTIPRYVSKDTVVDGHTFKEGSTLLGSLFNLHHDENIWGDPWVFRPERFLDTNGKLLPSTDQPMKSLKIFGFGFRDCKAKETSLEMVETYLLHVFCNYNIKCPKDSELPSFDPRDYSTVTIVDMPKFKCRFERRN